MLKTIKTIDNIIMKIEKFFLSYSIILTTIVLVGNVIARRVFMNSWSWAEEVGQFLVVVTTFMGVGYAAREGSHINMSALIDLSANKVKKVIAVLSAIITMITMFIFAYYSFKYFTTVVASGRVTPALELPVYIITMFMPIGFTLGGIQYLINLVLNLKYKDDIYFNNISPLAEYDEEIVSK
ncbi:MAG: TRAP transporter small permease [Tissierellaceae bacterium]|nr:TRAP transporter small permease [Tissierellaceae bacterium]